ETVLATVPSGSCTTPASVAFAGTGSNDDACGDSRFPTAASGGMNTSGPSVRARASTVDTSCGVPAPTFRDHERRDAGPTNAFTFPPRVRVNDTGRDDARSALAGHFTSNSAPPEPKYAGISATTPIPDPAIPLHHQASELAAINVHDRLPRRNSRSNLSGNATGVTTRGTHYLVANNRRRVRSPLNSATISKLEPRTNRLTHTVDSILTASLSHFLRRNDMLAIREKRRDRIRRARSRPVHRATGREPGITHPCTER